MTMTKLFDSIMLDITSLYDILPKLGTAPQSLSIIINDLNKRITELIITQETVCKEDPDDTDTLSYLLHYRTSHFDPYIKTIVSGDLYKNFKKIKTLKLDEMVFRDIGEE